MDYSLQQIIKKEKEDYKEDFELSVDDFPNTFYIEVNVEKQQNYDEFDWSYNSLKTSFEEICSICGLIFKNRFILLQHNITHLSITLEPLTIIPEDNLDITKTQTQSLRQCESCNKVMSYKSWNAHIKEVHSDGKYICEMCNRKFQCKRYLKTHIRNVHRKVETPNSTVKCPICSKICKNRACLYCHMRNKHSEEKHQCEICGSNLKCYSYYLTHLRRVHYNDGKQHKCDLCHKSFKSPRYVSIHKKNSHGSNRSVKKVKIKKEK